MLLNLEPLFSDERQSSADAVTLSIDCFCEPDSSLFNEEADVSKIHVTGTVSNNYGLVMLESSIKFSYKAPCDRCLTTAKRDFSFDLSHRLVNKESDNDDGDDILVEGCTLDLDALITTDILLQMPSRFLCSDECKGLCPGCGADLNKKNCSCEQAQIDPRLSKLKEFFDRDKNI